MVQSSPRQVTRVASLFARHLILLSLFITFARPAGALAQGDRSYWGVGVSFVPAWTSTPRMQELLIEGEGTLEGSEFSVGMVRGRTQPSAHALLRRFAFLGRLFGGGARI